MERTCEKQETEPSFACVFELPGESAVVINGVPDMPPGDSAVIPLDNANESESHDGPGFGKWLEGREVKKLFGDQYFSGKVVEFDKETNWYRVVYEDGDSEELEWHELQEVLVPLDIGIPLKALAMKICRFDKSIYDSTRNSGRSKGNYAKSLGNKRKVVEVPPSVFATKRKRGRPRKENVQNRSSGQENLDTPFETPTFSTKSTKIENRDANERTVETKVAENGEGAEDKVAVEATAES